VEINSVWAIITENIKISSKESLGYYELKKHKLWFDEGCFKILKKKRNKAKCSGYRIQAE
jgi:hypothetical protein